MTANEAIWTAGLTYIRHIPSWARRVYALEFLNYLLHGGPEPTRAVGVKPHACAAVEERLREIAREKREAVR